MVTQLTMSKNYHVYDSIIRHICQVKLHSLTAFRTSLGGLKKQRAIISSIGSNLTLKYKKLFIEKVHPFLLIENELKAQKELLNPLEPKKKLVLKEQNTTNVVSVPNLLPRQGSNLRPID